MFRPSRSIVNVLVSLFQSRTILAILLILPFILAIWQYQRGATREAALAKFDQAERLSATPLTSVSVTTTPDMRRVLIDGQSIGQPAELDNVIRDQQVGVRVLQPVKLIDHTIVLVDRGWRPRADMGKPLALLPHHLKGRWVPTPQHFTLPGATFGTHGRIDALDRMALVKQFGRQLRDGVVVLEETVPSLDCWPARPPFDPARHYAYALQWMLLGVCLLMGAMHMRKR